MNRHHELFEGIPYYNYENGDIVQIVREERVREHEPWVKDYGRKFRVKGNDGDSLPVRVFYIVALDDPKYERSLFSHKLEFVKLLESEAEEL